MTSGAGVWVRRLLLVLAAVAQGAAFLVLAGGRLMSPLGGVAVLGSLAVLALVGGRWGPGPVARGVRAPWSSWAGLAVVALCALAVPVWWWPDAVAGLPVGWFLFWMAVSGSLLVPIGVMGAAPVGGVRAEGGDRR